MSKKLLAEISVGELLDKISILEIKKKKIKNKDKLNYINSELLSLKKIRQDLKLKKNINILYSQLKNINLILWNTENKIRKKEKLKIFDKTFISLARKIYKTNDLRSKIKLRINLKVSSNIIEVKSY